MGVLTMAAISTTATGPLIGGILTDAFGWHAIFTVNAPLAVLAAVLILLWVPKDPQARASFARLMEEVDWIGVGLFAAFLLSLMVFLMNLKDHGRCGRRCSAQRFSELRSAAYSRRRPQPFIDVPMLVRNRPLAVTYLRAAAVSLIVFSVYYGFAQWLQSAFGFSSSKAGLVTLPMSIVAAVSSLTGVRSKGLRAPFAVSIGAALAGCIGLFIVDSTTFRLGAGDCVHVLWRSARHVFGGHAGRGLHSGARRGDRHGGRPAADCAIYRRDVGCRAARVDLRATGDRSRPARPRHRHGRAQRAPPHRHAVRPHDSGFGIGGSPPRAASLPQNPKRK